MIFVQYYLDCLSHASYLVGDETTGRAVVVDPRRDIDEYVADAEAAGLTIELVLETHFHADFLSGHLELAEATGAEIGFSSVAETEFPSRKLEDGEIISLGEVQLEILHTPGHTPESMSIVVSEHAGDEVPYGVLTGDTLFIGDVGRPDLLASIGFTREELGEKLYDSLHTKLMPLPGATRVYPAHGAGSACGKNLSTETWSTIAEQMDTNYALQAKDRSEFLELVTEGQAPAPDYFVYDAVLNRKHRPLLDEADIPEPLSLATAMQKVSEGALLVDGRDLEDFGHGHLIGSINVGLEGRFSEYVGSSVSPETEIVLVVDPGLELEAKNRLGRIGFDHVVGYVANPLAAMFDNPDLVARSSRVPAAEIDRLAAETDNLQIVDVRNPAEVEEGEIDGSLKIPVSAIPSRMDELDPDLPVVIYCAGGYRSSLAASILRANGFSDVSELVGGYTAYSALTSV